MNLFSKILVGFSVLVLTACGGGGGGQPDITYTGATNRAILTADNDDEFGTAMLEGGATSSKVNPFTASANQAGSSAAHLQLLETLASQIKSDIEQYAGNGQSGNQAALSTISPAGPCGGTMSISGNNTSGNITYTNFCVGDPTGYHVTMSGTISFTAVVSNNNTHFEITVNYSRLSITISDGTTETTETFSGTIMISWNTDPFSFEVSISSRFERNGQVFRVDNLSLTDGQISGRLYHPDYGYVDISSTPFTEVGSDYCGGTLTISGVDSNGDPVSATLEVSPDCSTYTMSFNGGMPEPAVDWH